MESQSHAAAICSILKMRTPYVHSNVEMCIIIIEIFCSSAVGECACDGVWAGPAHARKVKIHKGYTNK